ncbi:phasin [Rhizobium deserti]|uniref:Phasin n=2 Tax=Rhizobium deserti TaxID=2547961 RepID=A0A4R5UGX1_9HYPH|nr:phasin [Rhizobium deserti]
MAYRTDDMFSFAAFDPSKMNESFRDLAEKGVNQSREAYAKMKMTAEEATTAAQSTIQSAQAGTLEIGLQAMDAIRTNADMSLAHLEQLFSARSISEFMQLQTAFIRQQTEFTLEQARAMQDSTRKLAKNVVEPGRQAAEKAMASFKAA